MVMQITTLATVKAQMGGTTTASDAQITAMLDPVSDFAEDYMNRHLQVSTRTEVYEIAPTKPYLWLRGFPIGTVTSIKFSSCRDFSTAEALDSTTYDVITDSGEIYFRGQALSKFGSGGFVQIVYSGGMAADTAGFMSAYPRQANAAASEVINRLNRAKNPDGKIEFGMAGGVGYQKQLQPLDDFKNALASQRRVV